MEHDANAFVSIVCSVVGIVIDVNPVFSNAWSSIVVIWDGIVNDVREIHPLKVYEGIDVIDDGNEIYSNE